MYLLIHFKFAYLCLTLSWRRPLLYRNQSIDLLRKPMDWFPYDNGLRHERIKYSLAGGSAILWIVSERKPREKKWPAGYKVNHFERIISKNFSVVQNVSTVKSFLIYFQFYWYFVGLTSCFYILRYRTQLLSLRLPILFFYFFQKFLN